MIFVAILICWLVVLLRVSPAWLRALNRGSADFGRAVAWFCSGGLGWHLARIQLERERRAEAMARLLIDVAGWRERARARSTGLAQYVASPQRGGLPGEVWKPGYGWVSRHGNYHYHG